MKLLNDMRRVLGVLGVAFLATCGNVLAADIVTLVSVGDVRAVTATGASRTLAKGAELRTGERLETGANGRAQLKFSDGAVVSVQPETSFRVDQYQFSGKEDGKEQVSMSLLKGAFRTITGLIGRTNKTAYRLVTPTATVGIRGTEYLAQLFGQSLTIAVGEGSIGITNNFGTIVVNTGQTGFVRSPNSAPQVVAVVPTLAPAPAVTVAEAKKSEERSATGSPVTVQDNSSGSINSLYTSVATTGTTSGSTGGSHGGGTTGSATGGTSSGAVSAALGAGPYSIVYAAGVNVGIDGRDAVNATFSSAGAMQSYTWTVNSAEAPTAGTNAVADVAGNQHVAVGRWNGGTTGGGFYSSGGLNFSANQGFHYAIGVPSPTLPATGTATYAVRSATSPTVADGSKSPGTATGSLAVQWGGTSTKVGLHLSVTMPGETTYQVLSTGGTANPASTEIVVGTGGLWSGFNLLTTGSGYSCSGTCNTSVRGFFAGSAQEGAGLSYRLGTNATSKAIDGAMSFQPGSISTVSSLTLPSTGGVGPLGSAPDRIFTSQAGAVGGAGPGFFTNAAFNTSNALTSFTTFTGGNTNGTASVSDFGGNSFVAWGRWNNGTPTQTSSLGTSIPVTAIPANAGFHYLVGVPATTIPASGTATYSLAGASAPTISDGSIAPGSFAGSLAVNFAGAATRVALAATVTMGADIYTMTTTGGLANPSTSQIAMANSGSAANKTTWAGVSSIVVAVPVTGVTNCVGCQATIQGSFFGANLEAAGINYNIGGVGGGLKSIQGSAAFSKNAPAI